METKTAPYDVVEFLVIPEEIAAYLEACIQESDGDTEFIPKPFGDITYTKWVDAADRTRYWTAARSVRNTPVIKAQALSPGKRILKAHINSFLEGRSI